MIRILGKMDPTHKRSYRPDRAAFVHPIQKYAGLIFRFLVIPSRYARVIHAVVKFDMIKLTT